MATRWADHLTGDLLPWWSAHAADDEKGGVRTGFSNDGILRTSDRFTWSQGRWAWLAGELADDGRRGLLDVDADAWQRRCVATCRRMIDDALRPDQRCHFRVTQDGRPVTAGSETETATSVFADLFCVLGLTAGLRQLPGDDPRAREWAGAATGILATACAAVADGTARTEPYPVPDGYTDLAGPMTLLHVAAELLRTPCAAAHPIARTVRDWAVRRLRERHVGPGRWAEFAATDPGFWDALLARHRTPGHLLELLWMIDHAQRDDPTLRVWPRGELASRARWALQVGWDEEHGGLLRFADAGGGRPRGQACPGSAYEDLVNSTWSTKLWWVHAEALYALHLLAPADDELVPWRERVTDWTLRVFPDPDRGEWIQIRDRAGAPLDEVVALPVKDPFHVIRTMIFLNRLDAGAAEAPEQG